MKHVKKYNEHFEYEDEDESRYELMNKIYDSAEFQELEKLYKEFDKNSQALWVKLEENVTKLAKEKGLNDKDIHYLLDDLSHDFSF